MKLLNRILSDIKCGENIDLYLTVPTAILVGILNLAGVLSPTLVAPLTLVVLGLITITILGSRYRVEQLADKLTPSAESIFKKKSPPTLEQDIENAFDLWLVGVLGSKHARDFYSIIEQKLKKGHLIKILTIYSSRVSSR